MRGGTGGTVSKGEMNGKDSEVTMHLGSSPSPWVTCVPGH